MKRVTCWPLWYAAGRNAVVGSLSAEGLNDDEIRRLMIDVVDRRYRYIRTLFDENTGGQLLLSLAHRDPLPQWKEPKLLTGNQSKPGTG
jgi:hypothetical protein